MQDVEMGKAYQFYFRTIQILVWRFSKYHLVVKSPEHLRYLDRVLTVFPDAQIIWVHRDPLETIPSKCSLISNFHQFRSYLMKPRQLGELTLRSESQKIERALEFRSRAGEDQFCDVFSSALQRSPLDVVRRIYDASGRRFSKEVQVRMENWIQQTRAAHKGPHSYKLSTFGLTSGQVNHAFSAYRERFDIAID
jgi:hypothetical protein